MELKISNNIIAEIELCLINFRKIIKGIDLKKAVYSSLTIRSNIHKINEETLKEIIYYGTNWGVILSALADDPDKKSIKFRMSKIQYKDKIVLKPGSISSDNNFRFVEERIDGEDILITQDMIPGINYTLKNYIDNVTFQFGFQPTWNALIEL